MGEIGRELSRLVAAGLKNKPPGKYADGGGLWLNKREVGGAQWFFRYTMHGKRREMGLGPFPDVSLRDARLMAEEHRAAVRSGTDPIRARQAERQEARKNLHTLRDIALDAFESRKADLKGDGKAGRWFSPLELHVLPKLGTIPVAEITQVDIRNVLAPIWHTKADTAAKALNRLAICMRHAAALGLDVDLQATEKARALLGKSRHAVTNVASVPWAEVPAFYATLSEPSTTNLALRLLILTGQRSAPIRFLRDEQIDGDIWTIPGEKMKGKKGATADFRVPLSPEALVVIALARETARDGFLFPSVRKGVISDATMSRMMERRGMAERPHGFRSSLRTWLAEATDAPHEIAETVLAHVSGSKVVRTYRRTDYLEQRRDLLNRWSEFVANPVSINQS